jgi:hypothetical protein
MSSSSSDNEDDYEIKQLIMFDLINNNQQWYSNNGVGQMQQLQLDASLHLLAPERNRNQPCQPYCVFRHAEALHCIQHDYLGNDALFVGKNFEMMFRFSMTWVQWLLEDIGNARVPFL